VFLQHPGSDTSVWKDKPLAQRMEAMQEAAGAQNFLLRVKDIPAVLDQLDRWNKTDGHVLAGRLDLMRVGMSGHSFGAVTTQAVSGQSTGRGKLSFTDPRIKAAIAFSPSSPRRGGDPKQAFGNAKALFCSLPNCYFICCFLNVQKPVLCLSGSLNQRLYRIHFV
jgi:predicted dienelactone hydrolase